MKNKNMVKFKYKNELLRKLDSNRIIKYYDNLLQAHERLLDEDKFISKHPTLIMAVDVLEKVLEMREV